MGGVRCLLLPRLLQRGRQVRGGDVKGSWEAGAVLLQNRLLQLVQPGLPVHRSPPRCPSLGARPLARLHPLLPILETVTPPSLFVAQYIYMFPCPPTFVLSYFPIV